MWNVFLVNAGNFEEDFTFINAKWLIPSVLCEVEKDTMLSTRVPALAQHGMFVWYPEMIYIPASIVGTAQTTFWDDETLMKWEIINMKYRGILKSKLHKRRHEGDDGAVGSTHMYFFVLCLLCLLCLCFFTSKKRSGLSVQYCLGKVDVKMI